MKQTIVLFFLCFVFVFNINAQSKIKILNANSLEYDEKASGKITKLIGNVQLSQDKTILYCDSAYQYEDRNYVEAFNNVHINHQDSIQIYGDMLKYDGTTKQAEITGNVRLTEKKLVLTTDKLYYDLKAGKAYYFNKGKIVNGEQTLTSQNGYYYSNTKEFFFRKDIVLLSKDYSLLSDSLKYNTMSHQSKFFGPTRIISDDEKMYCERGIYDSDKEIAYFNQRAVINTKGKLLKADSLYYEKRNKYGKAFNHIELIDTENMVMVFGDFGELMGKEKKYYVTQYAYAKKIMQNDTLILIADTIYSYDKTNTQKQIIKAYHHAKVYKSDMQSVCDSLVYNYADSNITLYTQPALWSGNNQITADTIILFINNRQLDSFYLNSRAFVISKETAKFFNQVKGRNMKGRFLDNKIQFIRVYGNGQSIYYAKEDSSYIGVNVVDCSEMEFYFENNKIKRGVFITQPDATLYPLNEMKPEELRLKGFEWKQNSRPNKKLVKQYFKH